MAVYRRGAAGGLAWVEQYQLKSANKTTDEPSTIHTIVPPSVLSGTIGGVGVGGSVGGTVGGMVGANVGMTGRE